MVHSSPCRWSTPRIRLPESTTSASIGCRFTTRNRPDCTGRFKKAAAFTTRKRKRLGQPLPVTVFLGGPPALILAAIAPLPEDVPELVLASLLAGEKLKMTQESARRSTSTGGGSGVCSGWASAAAQTTAGRTVRRSLRLLFARSMTIRCLKWTRSFIVATRSIRQPWSANRARKIFSSATICSSCCRRCFRW